MLPEEEKFSLEPKSNPAIILPNASTMVNIKSQDYETIEYFSLKQHLRNTYYQNGGFLTKFRKRKCKLFQRPSPNDVSPFETILLSSDDKSAIISLILRTFNLWNDDIFWTKVVNLEKVMKYYATNENTNVKNLFSILLYDWHCPGDQSSTYALCEKFDAYINASGESMFRKLFRIIDDSQHKEYGHICLRIIYHYLYEKNEKLKDVGNFYERTLYQDIITHTINDALAIQNEYYKFQILKIFTVFMDNTCDDNYKHLKSKILENVAYNFECHSAYRVSLSSIEKYCDEKFFEIIFLLKENRLKKFEFEFEALIKIYQKFYGEYWKIAIKANARLLYHVCEDQCEQKLLKTVEFIFHKCSFIELNSTILTTFEEVADFYTVFNEPLSESEEKFLNFINEFFNKDFFSIDEFKEKCIQNKKFTRKIIFGRRNVNEKSLLERILSHPRLYSLIDDIWTKFQLFEKPELLNLKNFMGKSLLYYTYKAGINQVVAFLMLPSYHKSDNFKRPKYYMVMHNSQIFSLTGKCLLEYQIDIFLGIEELEHDVDLFVRIIYMLEEIGQIDEIQNDEVINYFLDLMYKTEKYSHELFEIDDLLGIMVIYWNPHKGDYDKYKQILITINPFFDLLFMTIEKQYDEFISKFPSKFDELEEAYETRYDVSVIQKDRDDHQYELYSSNFMFILFLAAIRTEQHKMIDFIFKNDWFVTINFGFPDNVKAGEIHYYAALNLLKHGHELGRANIPEDWLTREVLEEFLNSRISYRDEDYIEVDCASLLHAESQKIKVKGSGDVTDKLLMLEDTMSLKYIRDHENVKMLITHPVIETYINLKSYKYQRIFVYNFWAFVLLYILPFISLITHNHMGEQESTNHSIFISNKWHFIGIIFLILRELFQGIVSGSISAYFSQRSNIFDTILIGLSIALSTSSICVRKNTSDISSTTIPFLEVALILFTTISATSLLPLSYVPINMQILKKVSLTFLKIFYTFAIILIAFSLSFCIMFENQNNPENINCTKSEKNETKEEEEEDNDDPRDNFRFFHTSLLKIMMMLSGEYSIEPITLTFSQIFFFAVFVTSSFILFNLILGLSIEDVQELKNGSRQFNLLTKAKKLINVGEKLDDFYNYVSDYRENRYLVDGKFAILKDFMIDISFIIVRFALSKYIYLHGIQKIYIHIKTGKVFINIDRNYEPVLTINRRIRKDTFKVDDTTLGEIQQIINAKNKKMFKNLKRKMYIEKLQYR